MIDQYILDGHKVVPCDDVLEWEKWFKKADRHVAVDTKNDVRVDTVFLGINHSFVLGAPLFFETRVFGGEHDDEMEQYSTWEEAAKGHQRMVKKCIEQL